MSVIATSIPSALQVPSSHDLRYMRRQQHVPHVPRGLYMVLSPSEVVYRPPPCQAMELPAWRFPEFLHIPNAANSKIRVARIVFRIPYTHYLTLLTYTYIL